MQILDFLLCLLVEIKDLNLSKTLGTLCIHLYPLEKLIKIVIIFIYKVLYHRVL